MFCLLKGHSGSLFVSHFGGHENSAAKQIGTGKMAMVDAKSCAYHRSNFGGSNDPVQIELN